MPPSTANAEAWANTNLLSTAHTRIMGSNEATDRENKLLGSQVAPNMHEMFAICPAGEALQLAFERLQPTFIAVHDIGINRSASLLAELAGALRQPLQTLSIRQQGTGVTLAKLQFIELPGQRATPLRLYATAAEADTATRSKVAQTLIAFSRLGVLLVGALPDHALTTHFNPLRDRLLTVPWNNRNLLLVPQGPTTGLVGQAMRLVDGTLVQANAAPPATQTGPIWKSIHEAWSRLRNAPAESPRGDATPPVLGGGLRLNLTAAAPAAPVAPGAPVAPLAAATAPTPAAGTLAQPASDRMAAYAQACGSLRGAATCAVFEVETGRLLAQAGPTAVSVHLITQSTTILKSMAKLESDLQDAAAQGDVMVTLSRHLVVMRRLARMPSIGMALVLDRDKANPMVMRAHLQRLEPLLDE